jgi:tRNA A-37 threonylcarbamoyl transferase component Bud32
VLLTREVTDAEPLRQLMFNVYPFLSAAEKRAFAVRFSAFICNLHDLGVEHRDLHIGNILVQGELTGGQFLLLDTDRVRCHPGSLGMRKRAANLAQVLMNFWKLSNRSERFRFLRNYLKEQRLNAGFASLIETDSLKQARRSWHKRAVLALSNGPHFKLGRRDGWSFWRSTSSEASNVQQILLPEPDQILCGGRTLKAGNTVTAAEISTGASRFFLKRYNDKGSWYRFRNAFRRSRALRTWIMSWEFIERGLPVPLPLICIEKRRWLMLRQTYLASCFIEGWRLPEYWQSASASEQAALLVRIALVLGKMHRSGCIHGDLKWNNLLVDANGAVHLIDLDGSYVSRWISRHRTKDIRRFVANMQRYRLDDKEQRLFLSVWKRWATPM